VGRHLATWRRRRLGGWGARDALANRGTGPSICEKTSEDASGTKEVQAKELEPRGRKERGCRVAGAMEEEGVVERPAWGRDRSGGWHGEEREWLGRQGRHWI
jgi:hypothetical protein